jgi:hypothetical protein
MLPGVPGPVTAAGAVGFHPLPLNQASKLILLKAPAIVNKKKFAECQMAARHSMTKDCFFACFPL